MTDEQQEKCPRCTRGSYSFASFGWCPWCDHGQEPPKPHRTVVIDGQEFVIGGHA